MTQTGSGSNGSLSVRTLDDGERVRLFVEGELDVATVPRLNGALLSVEQNDHRSIVLDLGSLTFMDASGLTAILSSHHRAAAQGKAFTVESCRGIVARVFSLTGQEAVLGLDPSEPAAHE